MAEIESWELGFLRRDAIGFTSDDFSLYHAVVCALKVDLDFLH